MSPDSFHYHGGDIQRMAAIAGRPAQDILDFSVNIRPEGTVDVIRASLFRAMQCVEQYPSPHAEELCHAAAQYHNLNTKHFVFGNGSNELIHALARALAKSGCHTMAIMEPAFSEYALAATRAGISVRHFWNGIGEQNTDIELHCPDLATGLLALPPASALVLSNPANPSGMAYSVEELLSYMRQRLDILWIIDEAFIHYVGTDAQASLLPVLPSNALVLRSLTKFYALPGIRLGYMVAKSDLVRAVQNELPSWSVNSFAIAAGMALFTNAGHIAHDIRKTNARRRAALYQGLQKLPQVQVFSSTANYILFRWPYPAPQLHTTLLQDFGIAIRDCHNYYGLSDGTWFRVAVRTTEQNQILLNALQCILEKTVNQEEQITEKSYTCLPYIQKHKKSMSPALMIQGTSSNAGKSILAAAYCRIFRQDGYSVAPFKAQNMSLNSGVTPCNNISDDGITGGEMGRAQILQAQAASIDPDVRMNPILLKPHSDTGSQVIVLGKPLTTVDALGNITSHMSAREYFTRKKELWSTITEAYDSLAAKHDIMVLEGAGSPAEVNLKSHDVVNMRMAAHAKAKVLLTGDIDRGGVYAALLGTWMTFSPEERRLVAGYLINNFRGDASFLNTAHEYMHSYTGVSVLGVVPHIPALHLPEEDMASFSWVSDTQSTSPPPNTLDIGVVMLRHIANYTDMTPLSMEPDVHVRPIRALSEWGNPHVIIIPGSKSVAKDIITLRQQGLTDKILQHAAAKKSIFGICAGLQILGKNIYDPYGIESDNLSIQGLGIMDVHTTLMPQKTLMSVKKAETPLKVFAKGYEIHHGKTEHGASALPLFLRVDREYATEAERICGYVSGQCWTTYLHGIFDDDTFRHAWIDHMRENVGLTPTSHQRICYDIEEHLDRLAHIVRENTDMKQIYAHLNI